VAGPARDPSGPKILGDQHIPYEGEMKRFRAEGDFLLRALANLISQSRSQVHLLEHELTELSKLVEQHDLPREIRKALHQMLRLWRGRGLDENQLRERLDKLQRAANASGISDPRCASIGPGEPARTMASKSR
jgi:hypothetical protein